MGLDQIEAAYKYIEDGFEQDEVNEAAENEDDGTWEKENISIHTNPPAVSSATAQDEGGIT